MKRASISQGVFALEDAVSRAQGRLPDRVVGRSQDLLTKVRGRRTEDMSTTVAVFAGATGSGKSSLFNALLGQPLAAVSAMRPTTSEALAVSGEHEGGLIDWLSVPTRATVQSDSWLDDTPLVLVDLPDIDSTYVENRTVAEHLIERADVVIWVVDPQKYADGVLHLEFLRHLREQSAGMLVVLNQVDLLSEVDRKRVVTHLDHMLRQDGFDAPLLETSARTGAGIELLRDSLITAANSKRAAAKRLAGDLRLAAADMQQAVEADGGSTKAPQAVPSFALLEEPLATALGANLVADAAARSYVHQGVKTTGWPWTRWVRNLRADPLERLHLKSQRGSKVSPLTSVQRPPTQAATIRATTRRYAQEATNGLPRRWRNEVVQTVEDSTPTLTDAADRALTTAQETYLRRPAWWSLLWVLQWIAALVAVVGLGWLLALWAASMLMIRFPEPPYWGPLAVPTILLVAGLLSGWLLAVLARMLLGVGARRTYRRVRRALIRRIGEVARGVVLAPLRRQIESYGRFLEDLDIVGTVRGD